MLEFLPIDPILDASVRHISELLPDNFSYFFLLGWSIWKWEKQKEHGKRRDRKDWEQDERLDILEGKVIMQAEFIASPNYSRRLGRSIKKVVVHSMAGYMQPSIDALLRPAREASAHYLIGHDGRLVQMVHESDAAWHCGSRRQYWFIYPFNNTDTIGIETEGGRIGDQTIPFGEAGHKTLAKLLADIHKRYGWGEPSSKTVVMHRDMPGTSTACPTGVEILKVIQEAQDEYNGRNTPVVHAEVPHTATYKVAPKFTKNLEPSQSYRKEVRDVQEFLVRKGFMKVASNEYGYYGRKTQAGIDKFQKSVGIVVSTRYYGFWYDKTREAANKLI